MTGEAAVVQFRSPVEAWPGITRSPHEGTKRPAGSSSGRGTSTSPNIVAVEQWLCLLSIFVCGAYGESA